MRLESHLRPRTVGEILDASFFLYRRLFWPLLLICTIVSVPALLVAGLTAEWAGDAVDRYTRGIMEMSRTPQELNSVAEFYADTLLPLVNVGLLLSVLQAISRGGAMAACAVVVKAVVDGAEAPTWRRALRVSLPRIPAISVAYFVSQQLAGFACCCLPVYVVLLVLLLPLPAIMMFEQGPLELRARRAMLRATPVGRLLLRCIALPAGMGIDGTIRCFALGIHVGTIARGTLLGSCLFVFLLFFVTALAVVPQALMGSPGATFWAQHYAEVAFLPILGLSVSLWYVDLRVRREGFDLERESSSDVDPDPLASSGADTTESRPA